MSKQYGKVGLKLNIQKTKIMTSSPITSWQIDGETMETLTDFIFSGSKITANDGCSHEVKRCLLLGRKAMTNLAAAAAKSLQSCPTLCDLIDGSPTGSSVPGILQARILEWVAISFCNAWNEKWKWSRLVMFIHWRRKWQPTPVFLPGESQGRGSLVGCHLWGRTELDTAEST